MNVDRLSGVLPVIGTPFDEAYAVDSTALRSEIDWLLANGAHGIVVAMVSEIQRLSTSERAALSDLVCELTGERGPVIASVGAESTVIATSLAADARRGGASAVMVTPPLLGGIDEAELRRYLEAIFAACELPIVLQDASGYVGQSIDSALQARLVDDYGRDVLLLKPEAIPLGPTVSAIHAAGTTEPRVFDGSGGRALVETHARGIVGTMPGPDLVWAIRAMWNALEAGNRGAAIRISSPLTMLQSLVNGLDSYIAFEKHLLVRQQVFSSDRRRGPLEFSLDDVARSLADDLFAEIELAVAREARGE